MMHCEDIRKVMSDHMTMHLIERSRESPKSETCMLCTRRSRHEPALSERSAERGVQPSVNRGRART